MKPEVLLELLESTAEQLHIKVTYEPLQSTVVHGGLCRVKGQYRIIIDKRATPEERVATLASSLARLIAPDERAVHPPKVQDALSYYSAA